MTNKKVGRNDPCPCGSGKKYKKCCLLSGDIGFDSKNVPPVKISTAIIEIARPLLEKYQKRNRVSVLIELAILAWNLSFTSDEKMRDEAETSIINNMPDEIDAVGVVSIMELVDMMLERKNKLYPDLNLVVMSHDLSFGINGQMNLDIRSANLDN